MEIWKKVDGTNGMIEVSNEGRVRSLLRGTPFVLKTQRDGKGYHRLRYTLNREKKALKLHREVAKAFIPNPNNFPQVNHIDGNKDNNSVSNLEWVTNKQNAHHAINNGLWDSVFEGANRFNESKRKVVTATNGVEVLVFDSVNAAEKYFNSKHISDVLKGKRTNVKGWTFAYGKGVML